MYSNPKLSKRIVSFLLMLSLVLNIVLSSGVLPVAVRATGEAESAAIYVDGVEKEGADGTKEKPYATLLEAYADIPDNNVKTYIVISGKIVVTNNGSGTNPSAGVNWNGLNWWLTSHAGEVVLTSKHGDDDYTATASFQLDRNWILLGNTSFENIRITHAESSAIYANHYNFRLGENVKYPTSGYAPYQVVTQALYLGGSQAIYNLHKTEPQNVTFTMESGAITNLYGTGNGSQGSSELNAKCPDVTINIAGGSVTTLDIAYSQWQKIGNINVNIGSNATVAAMTATYADNVTGTKTLEYKGVTGQVPATTGFDVLKLTNSNVTIPSLDAVTSIVATDDSRLTLTAAPAAAVNVTVTKAGDGWNTSNALITAPADAMFVLTNTDCTWSSTSSDTNTVWKLVENGNEEETTPEETVPEETVPEETVPEATLPEDLNPVPEDNVFYVDGIGGTNANGSQAYPFATVAEAYAQIKNEKDSDKTTIVICGAVNMASAAQVGNYKGFSAHKGEVVFTSKHADIDYRQVKTDVVFTLDTSWALFGNTTFQDIAIAGDNTTVFADYYNLTLGEDVTGTFAKTVYLGTQSNIYYAVNEAVVAKDVVFTMKSGTIGTLECFGLNNQGYSNNLAANARSYNVTLDINGGNIGTVQATYNASYVYPKINNFKAILGNGAAAIDWAGVVDSERIIGTTTLEYKDATGEKPAATGFDILKLTNSNVTVPSLDGTTQLLLVDDSQLTLKAAPSATVSVTIAKAADAWNVGKLLITAPAGTAKEMFALTNERISWVYASSGSNATWKLGEVAPIPRPEGNIFYVDGVGSGLKDGSSKENAFATLADAYRAIPAGSTVTTIVICGEVVPQNGAIEAGTGGGTVESTGYFNHWCLPQNSGKVILTSVCGEEDYRETAGLKLAAFWYLLSDTTLQNINITGTASRILASYNALHLGKGITGSTVASDISLGTWSQINGTQTNKYEFAVKDVEFTMESGTVGKLYGGGLGTQSYTGDTTAGMNNTVTLNIKGGNVGTLYGTGRNANTHHESVAVNISGGKVGTLYGATATGTVYAGVTVTLSGGIVESIFGCEEGATIYGGTVLHYQNAQNVEMAAVQGFDTLKLTNSSVTVPAGMENVWSTVTKLQMTDNSTLTLATVPAVPAQKVEVTLEKSGENWNTSTAMIMAPGGTAHIFGIVSPLDYGFTYADNGATSWTLKYTGITIGSTGTAGEKLDIDLGLPENGEYTPLAPDASAYDTFLQKVEDLGAAKNEVNVVAPVPVKGQIELYVDSQNGNDSNLGGINAPLKTISKALTYVEALQKLNLKGIVVYLREGTYFASETIILNEAHSGKNGVPLIISAYKDEKVVITSSVDIPGNAFVNVTDTAIRDRLREAVRDVIVQVDLKAMGITELGSITYGDLGGPNYQIYVNGNEYIPARYPNATNLWVGEVLDQGPIISGTPTNMDSTGVEFKMQDFRPTLWKNDGNIWLKGSMYAEWDIKNIRVAEIRRDSIKLDGGAEYGARSIETNTYYYYNILEELDVPGEYYVDLNTGIMYLYPVADMDKATITYSGNADDLILLKNTENVVLNGLTITNGTGKGVHMNGCKQTIVQNCTITKVGTGVYMDNCWKSGVIYSDINEIANRPVEIYPTQEFFDYIPDLNFVQNCYIHSTGVKNPKFCAIYVRGVGNVVSHNLLQGGFSVSIYLQYAKECIVEYNEIVGSPTGTNDGGAIYIPSEGEGHHIRYNYIHDIGRFSDAHDPWAIYFDEGLSGNYAYGNIMMNVPGGFLANGGSNNVLVNNVLMNTTKRAESTRSFIGSDNLSVYTIAQKNRGRDLQRYYAYLELSEEMQKEVRERYPLVVALFDKIGEALKTETGDQTTGLFAAHGNYVANNIFYNHGNMKFDGTDHVYANNRIFHTDPFVDPAGHNFNLKDTIDTSNWGFTYTIPSMDRMGILTDSKQGIGDFETIIPAVGEDKANSLEVLLRWTIAGGADTYVVKIATNPELTENLREMTLEKTQVWFVTDPYFNYDTTYYWQVTAYSTAESRDVTPVSTEVMSFKTMTREEYLEKNRADTMVIEGTIKDAEALAEQIAANSEKYISGTLEALQEAIEIAKAAKDNRGYTQVEMNVANLELLDAIQEAKSRKNVYKVTIDMDLDKWSEPYLNKTDFAIEGDELKMHVTHVERTEAIYGIELDVREILCFKYKIDKEEAWNGFALAQTNPGAFVTSGTDAYLIVINPGQVELQKYQGGKKVAQFNVTIPANLFTGGEYCDIEIGAINNIDGTVGIHFKINDRLIFDPSVYIDTAADKTIAGTTQKLEGLPISGCGNFGIVVNPVNGDAYLKQADEDKLGLTDYKDPVIVPDDEPVDPDEPVEPSDPDEPVDPNAPTPGAPGDGEENGGFFAAIMAFFAAIIAFFKELFGIL